MGRRTFFFLTALTGILLAAVMGVQYVYQTASVSAKPSLERLVVIDPGHGGEDGGAEGLYQVVEKSVNLSISLKLKKMLEISGYEVIMTRTEDISIYEPGSVSLRQKKRSDLQKRLKIINKNPNAMVISIHQNKFSQSQYSGAQMFYGEKNPLSRPLAEQIQRSFVSRLQPENTRQVKPISSNVYLIRNAEPPAVLVECGFLSNPEEAKNLADDTYQAKVAFTIYAGIIEFYQQSAGAGG